MKKHMVITIGRQYGSGGHQVARELAELLGFKMYDKEIINLAAKESGISEEILKVYDEKPTNSFLYSLSLGAYSFENSLIGTPSIPIVDRVFAAQAQIIKDLAEEGPCIFVGRCANSILKDRENVLSVFVHTDLERRIDRICEYEKISRNEASSIIRNADKKRAGYYNYFSDLKWGDARSYDLCIDSRIGIENVAEVIKLFIEHHNAI